MSSDEVDENSNLEQLRDILINKSGDVKLSSRFRALFLLKSIGSEFEKDKVRANTAIRYIVECFKDNSELLKHEVAYVLGQTRNLDAAPLLRQVLADKNQQCMVRHEAAEALGALADIESLKMLQDYFENDPELEIRQTCELAIERIKWENSTASKTEILQESLYSSIDPAPPLAITQDEDKNESEKIAKLTRVLNDQEAALFERYRAMFRLRDIGTDEACLALASGFNDPSALFKHEIAYVFGQLCNPVTVPSLIKVLQDKSQAGMVRHEAAEALGSIATDEVLPILKSFLNDEEDVVRESAVVALDMYEYENSNEMEYATV
ncbi:hypothetical protein PACTADRAFT_51148 [Pachysolen tannophilus NRRL Y-2460]|uniref:Deoxyhypusine hydroxylase n=1 Tax=Pachysolen tannophilus NRRL Y-2460 TaxID=669874 RepID=A0A1E4TR91_PACTA|nr:hypothetical protein PACTADRAFT_51148 [Pachysolen tannophilus NRRL Y-2460]